eukprot:CAMPEP_0113328124 /NCGR_PEP_ID=MMETSP0010_2-20120614/19800_1 /TAXON_ID=216773 ORGANISM="Corethron hystrix, Strain 308" /NCGR_SAMPLE_ID=MMETSP0010_2 /ASSEMBLY_ACC=CAM_ASM_000155 /LENGTH=78 /DNA_ID=CAMNT_0000189327 /DNA_START=384 /DNA_END=617 /DNA_ORIENTATION=+ /assembly_acc=CAM_ASM_000155
MVLETQNDGIGVLVVVDIIVNAFDDVLEENFGSPGIAMIDDGQRSPRAGSGFAIPAVQFETFAALLQTEHVHFDGRSG